VWADSGDVALPVGLEADGPHRAQMRDRAELLLDFHRNRSRGTLLRSERHFFTLVAARE
jgi:hypothetical protein